MYVMLEEEFYYLGNLHKIKLTELMFCSEPKFCNDFSDWS